MMDIINRLIFILVFILFECAHLHNVQYLINTYDTFSYIIILFYFSTVYEKHILIQEN